MTTQAPVQPRTIREVVGLFDTYPALEKAVDELLTSGFARCELSLLADTARIPVPAIRTFLFAIEELLVTLAENDSRPLADIELVHDPCAEAGLVPDPVG